MNSISATMLRQQALAEAVKTHGHREWSAGAIIEAAETYFKFLSADAAIQKAQKAND